MAKVLVFETPDFFLWDATSFEFPWGIALAAKKTAEISNYFRDLDELLLNRATSMHFFVLRFFQSKWHFGNPGQEYVQVSSSTASSNPSRSPSMSSILSSSTSNTGGGAAAGRSQSGSGTGGGANNNIWNEKVHWFFFKFSFCCFSLFFQPHFQFPPVFFFIRYFCVENVRYWRSHIFLACSHDTNIY